MEGVFMRINRNEPGAVKSHEQAALTIENASSSEVSKFKYNENGRTIASDALHAEKVTVEEA